MLKIPLLVSLGHHGGQRKVASLRPPFSTPLRSLGEPDPDTPFLVPIEHAPPLFVRIWEDKISLKIPPPPSKGWRLKFKFRAPMVRLRIADNTTRLNINEGRCTEQICVFLPFCFNGVISAAAAGTCCLHYSRSCAPYHGQGCGGGQRRRSNRRAR